MAGFPSIDNYTNGFANGELILIGAFTSEGKSMTIVNLAWNAACLQGKRVAIVTAETLRTQYR
jgi:replicative DNA helicase